MKKIFIIIIAALMANTIVMQARELTGTVKVDGKSVPAVYRVIDDNTVALGNGRNACVSHYIEGFVSVPGSVEIGGNQYTVTEVSDLAFRLCEGIEGVEFEEGVTRVGKFAFIGCPYITEITLPASMQRLGSGAFQSCLSALETVTCKGDTPPQWEYNDVFVFHEKGISDNAAGIIPATKKLYVPDEDTYKTANYTNSDIGWTTPDGWGSFSYVHVGQATFHIDTPAELQILHEIVNVGHMYAQIGAVHLDADIDMSGYTWDCGMGISEEEAFEGKFYGNGHTISNLKINVHGFGGFFAHYGGHTIRDVTFKNCNFSSNMNNSIQTPNGALGVVVGECGAMQMLNVCLDNCVITSSLGTNGFLVGRCLTTGGANFSNCVVKDCFFDLLSSGKHGDLVGECSGGNATDCAIFNTSHMSQKSWMPMPFVGKVTPGNDFDVIRCYNTRQFFGGYNYSATTSNDYVPAENVHYTQVVLDKDRTVEYVDESGEPATKEFNWTTESSDKSAYFKTLFMIPELGLDYWSYQEGEFPVPTEMEQLLPEPRVNHATYRPKQFVNNHPRVNGLSSNEFIPQKAWRDMSGTTGYRSYNFIASRLWIDNDFTPDKPAYYASSLHNPILPIGTATITATNGIEFDRTLDVTHNGTQAYTLPNVKTDNFGNPIVDEDGYYVTEGETTLYEYDTYKSTDYTLYLPYSLNVNGGAALYQPVGVRHDDGTVIVEMALVEDGIIKPWNPYYIMVNDAPINLGVNCEVVIKPNEKGIDYQSFENDKYRIHGTPGKFSLAGIEAPYQLQNDDTWAIDHAMMDPFTCYITNESGQPVERFKAITQLSLHDDAENEDLISTYDGMTVDVVLKGRTFYKDGTWYPLCLPFDMDYFYDTPLEGAQICRFSASSYNEDNGELRVAFVNTGSIEAGKPYLVKWATAPRVDDPIFENVTIKNVPASSVRAGSVSMVATYSPVMLPDNDHLFYMGDDNQLFYPESPTQIKAFRAFFMLGAMANTSSSLRRVMLSFDNGGIVTAVDDLTVQQPVDNNWYTIDGRVLRDKPTAAGIYIHNGTKVLIK